MSVTSEGMVAVVGGVWWKGGWEVVVGVGVGEGALR